MAASSASTRRTAFEIAEVGEPGAQYVIACLCLNGPLAAPRGGIFMRFATLGLRGNRQLGQAAQIDKM